MIINNSFPTLLIDYYSDPFLVITDNDAGEYRVIGRDGKLRILDDKALTDIVVENVLTEMPVDYLEGEFYSLTTKQIISGKSITTLTDTLDLISLIKGMPRAAWQAFENLTNSLTEDINNIIDEGIEKEVVPADITERITREIHRIGHFLWANKIQVDSPMGAIYVSRDENDEFWFTRSNDGVKTFNLKELTEDWEISVCATIEYMTVGVEDEYEETQELFSYDYGDYDY